MQYGQSKEMMHTMVSCHRIQLNRPTAAARVTREDAPVTILDQEIKSIELAESHWRCQGGKKTEMNVAGAGVCICRGIIISRTGDRSRCDPRGPTTKGAHPLIAAAWQGHYLCDLVVVSANAAAFQGGPGVCRIDKRRPRRRVALREVHT
jgi:hypothetical protein